MNRTLVSMLFQETDPLYSRELLAMLLSYLVLEGYFQQNFSSNFTATQVLLTSISAGYFLIPLLYASEAAGLFARSLEKGSFGLLMTMPLRRDTLVWLYVLVSAVFSSLIFWIPSIILEWYISPDFNISLSVYVLFLLLGFILLYTSAGYLIASLTSSSVVTSIIVVLLFFIASVYSPEYFAKNSIMRVFFSGFNSFNLDPILNYSTLWALVTALAVSGVLLFLTPIILRRRGIRSGR